MYETYLLFVGTYFGWINKWLHKTISCTYSSYHVVVVSSFNRYNIKYVHEEDEKISDRMKLGIYPFHAELQPSNVNLR